MIRTVPSAPLGRKLNLDIRRNPRLALTLLILLASALVYRMIHHWLERGGPHTEQKTASVHLIRPTPEATKPPSQTPKPKAEPLPPRHQQVPHPVERSPGVSKAQPEESLERLEANASATNRSDAFGLEQGDGRGVHIGSQGQGGHALLFFGQEVQRMVTEAVRRIHSRDAAGLSAMVIHLWLTPEGHIERKQLQHSSGSRELDLQVMHSLDALNGRLSRPPVGIPQPLKLRIQP